MKLSEYAYKRLRDGKLVCFASYGIPGEITVTDGDIVLVYENGLAQVKIGPFMANVIALIVGTGLVEQIGD